MKFRLFVLLSLALWMGVWAQADSPERDARGWRVGPKAMGAAEVIRGPSPDEPIVLDLPEVLSDHVDGPTLVFYFSPTCPHCRAVGHEVQQLHERLAATQVPVLWVASGSASESAILEFKRTYGVTGPLVHDTGRLVGSAIGARSTPSAVLVQRVQPAKGRGKAPETFEARVLDFWYPYTPGTDGLVEGRAFNNPFHAFRPDEYKGNAHCAACHSLEYTSWHMTHHSVAWATLEREGSHTDPECVGCHVTGHQEPSGWDGEPRTKLVDVGCEACHGPGGPHDGHVTEPLSTCVGCHDDKHSIAFSTEKGLPHIDHYAAIDVTPEALKQRKLDLYQGKVPKALLAFPEGKNVGSAACQSCHTAEHGAWLLSAHAGAMDTLRDATEPAEAHTDPACVRCHATAKSSGLATQNLDDFHTDSGVGCESCHGPGEAHVAAPSADNIEGLGEDCPVCVLEAICTTCHTAEWDPEWDLDTRLKAISHRQP